jgi:hypothetical protein
MTELWYYAEGDETRGPLSMVELVPRLSQIANPRRVMLWRLGFEDWKAVEEVQEVAQQVLPPPLKRASSRPPPPPLPPPPPPPPPPPAAREPVVDAAAATHFKDVKPDLKGIGGWLWLLAFGQVAGILRVIVTLVQYYITLDPQVTVKFPAAIWGEAAINALVIWLFVHTAVLFFRRSRNFPRFFIWQMIVLICAPIADLLWVALMIARASGQPFADFLTLDAKDGGQIIVTLIAASIWITYILRSRRVANTFTG